MGTSGYNGGNFNCDVCGSTMPWNQGRMNWSHCKFDVWQNCAKSYQQNQGVQPFNPGNNPGINPGLAQF